MSQPEHRFLNATNHDSEEASRPGMSFSTQHLRRISLDVISDPLQGKEPEFSDSSRPLFAMYQRMTEEEDNKMAEELKEITRGTIIFVSPHLTCSWYTSHTQIIKECIILCCHCSIRHGNCHGPQAQLAGYFRLLSPEYLSVSNARSPQHITSIRPFQSRSTPSLLSAGICRFDQLILVLELDYQSYVRCNGDKRTVHGTSVPHGHPAITLQSSYASTDSRKL
jgi:hypothetical protein